MHPGRISRLPLSAVGRVWDKSVEFTKGILRTIAEEENRLHRAEILGQVSESGEPAAEQDASGKSSESRPTPKSKAASQGH